jgi:NADH-quinone oxidoreductase subunit N
MIWLAVAGVIASVIGAFYYLRIIFLMYFGEAEEPLDSRMPLVHNIAFLASALIMIVGIINLFGVEGYAATAAQALLQ